MDSLVVAYELLVVACMWNLVPWPRIEPRPTALGAQSLIHCATREVPGCWILSNAFPASDWDNHVVFFFCWCGASHWLIYKTRRVVFFLKESGGHLNDMKGLTYPFTCVGMFYFSSFSLGESPPPPPPPQKKKNSYQALNISYGQFSQICGHPFW